MLNSGDYIISAGLDDKLVFTKPEKQIEKGLNLTVIKKLDYPHLKRMRIANLEFKCLILTNGLDLDIVRIDKFDKILSIQLEIPILNIST